MNAKEALLKQAGPSDRQTDSQPHYHQAKDAWSEKYNIGFIPVYVIYRLIACFLHQTTGTWKPGAIPYLCLIPQYLQQRPTIGIQ